MELQRGDFVQFGPFLDCPRLKLTKKGGDTMYTTYKYNTVIYSDILWNDCLLQLHFIWLDQAHSMTSNYTLLSNDSGSIPIPHAAPRRLH